MANTPNLNLIELIYDNTKKVKDFFMNEIIGKINSNNAKIDTAITDKITQVVLKSSLPTSPTTLNNLYIVYGDTKDNNGQYRWNGTTYEKISTQLDYATKAEAEAGAENTKVMTPLRVREFFIANGGGSGGVTNAVFQSGKKYYKFTATTVVNNFEIPSNLFNPTTDVVELIHGGNIPLIKDENYTLVGNLVTFIGYSLNINDDIHCLITNTAYSFNALADKPDMTLKLDKTGDAKDTTVTFTEATTRENLLSGDKSSILWGKQSKINSDFETLKADKPIVIGGSNNIRLIGEIENYVNANGFYLEAMLHNPYFINSCQVSSAFLNIGKQGNSFSIQGKMQILIDMVNNNTYFTKIQITDTGKVYAVNTINAVGASWNIIKKTANVVIYNNPAIVTAIDGTVIWDSELNKTNIATSTDLEQKADKDRLQFKADNYKIASDSPSTYDMGITEFYSENASWKTLLNYPYGVVVKTEKKSDYYIKQEFFANGDTPLAYRLAYGVIWHTVKFTPTTDKVDILWSGTLPSISSANTAINLPYDIDTYDYLDVYFGSGTNIIGLADGLGQIKIYKYPEIMLGASNMFGFYGNTRVFIKYTEGNKKQINIWTDGATIQYLRYIIGVKLGG